MTNSADVRVHKTRELCGDKKSKTRGVGTERNIDRRIERAVAELVVDIKRKSRPKVAHDDTDVVFGVVDGEAGGGVGGRIVDSVDAKIVDDGMEQVAIGDDEAGFVGIFKVEGLFVEAEKIVEFVFDFVANTTDGDRLHGK